MRDKFKKKVKAIGDCLAHTSPVRGRVVLRISHQENGGMGSSFYTPLPSSAARD